MKKIIHTNAIRISLFATFLLISGLNLFAQYKLDLEWQKEPNGKDLNIWGVLPTGSDVIITAYKKSGQELYAYLLDSSGNIKRPIELNALVGSFSHTNIEGQIFGVSGYRLGFLDINTLKFVDYIDEKQNSTPLISGMHSNVLNRILAYGTSFIKVYEVKDKKLLLEYDPGIGSVRDMKASMSNDGKHISFGYSISIESPKGTFTVYNYLKLIDLNGKLIKDFGQTSSAQSAFTNDGKTLIYFMQDKIHFLDLQTLKEKEGIPLADANPENLEMSSDGKFMLLGFFNSFKTPNSLFYCDLESKQYYILNDNSSWINFKLNNDNSSLFYASSRKVLKYKLKLNSSIQNIENKLDLSIQVKDNDLILSSTSNISNFAFRVLSVEGKIQTNISPDKIKYYQNTTLVDISSLTTGVYFIEVTDNDSIVFSSKFIKAN